MSNIVTIFGRFTRFAAHFWEYEITNPVSGEIKWERYHPWIQERIFDELHKTAKLGTLKIDDTDFEIIFDHDHGKHRQRDENNGSECVVRKTPEVLVSDWNTFKEMSDINQVTKLDLNSGLDDDSKIKDDDAEELTKKVPDCESLWYLNLSHNKLTDAFKFDFGKTLATASALSVLDLASNKFGEETGIKIGAALTTNTSLHTLHLYGNQLKDEGGAAVFRGLKNNTTLKVLRMGRNQLGANVGVAIQVALANNTSLHELHLDGNPLGDQSGVAIATWLAKNTTLKTLSLRDNNLTDEAGAEFGRAVGTNTALIDLHLGNNKLGHTSGAAFGEALLVANKSLRRLNLGSNNLGDASGAAFGEALATNTSLKELFLGSNKLGDASGDAFGKVLATTTSLRILDLGVNTMSDVSGVAFGEALATNTSLTELFLGSNKLGDASGVAFGNALVNNKSLRVLDLSNNNQGDGPGCAFGKALTDNTCLTVLHLDNNNFGDASGVAFGEALATNTSLKKLDLDNNSMRFGAAFGISLTTNTSLKELYMRHNNLDEETGVALVNGLSQNSTLTDLNLHGNNAIFPATHAKIKFALSPELKGLLNTSSVSPSRIPVCVVGFDNVGKTELVNTWYRTTAHDNPQDDPEETAEAKPDSIRSKTSGISMKPVKLRLDTIPQATILDSPTKRRRTEGTCKTVYITAWDFAGHTQYYVSHELLMRACRGAVFVVLFRIDCTQPDAWRAEQERLFFWLKFIASMCANPQQPPTVFIGGTFRPDNDSFDVDATTEWTDGLLQLATEVFDGVLNFPQRSIYHMDCRKCNDPHVTALRNALAQAAEELRTGEDRKVPPICESANVLLQHIIDEVNAKLTSYEEHMKARQLNPNMLVEPLSFHDRECGPIMSRTDFEERVLGKLEVKADEIGGDEDFVNKLDNRFASEKRQNPIHNVPAIVPKSKKLLQIITAYLHDVGDVLWFDVDGLRDTVILTPDLFCSKIIGAIFRPNAPGFSVDAVHGGGGLVPKSKITTAFKRALGIDGTHVDAALLILCQLGLCHQRQDARNSEDSYLFPGALAATSYRRVEWFGSLPPGQHFVVGRRFTLANPTTTIFAPGCMSEIQVWVLGRYKDSKIWRDGVIIPNTATGTLAEAGVQLHHPYSSTQDGDKCARVSLSSITLVVRGSDTASQPDCLLLLNELCASIRKTSATDLVEAALPVSELALLASNQEMNMLDISCTGYDLSTKVLPATSNSDSNYTTTPLDTVVVVGGKRHTIDALRNGEYVQVSQHLNVTPRPPNWIGNDFAPVSPTYVRGGVHLTADVPRVSPEFIRIETNMHRSLPNAVINRIERVQNESLWGKYFLARADIAKSTPNPREIEAWHSTHTTDPQLIYSDWKAGFDVNRSIIEIEYHRNASGFIVESRFLHTSGKSYGTGVYVSEHAIYSDTIIPHVRPQNTSDGGKKQILLAKVILGNCKEHGAQIPDLRAAIEPEGYDSITGTEGNMQFLEDHKPSLVAQNLWTNAHEQLIAQGAEYGRQYIVHRSNQAYPAYVITYENESEPIPQQQHELQQPQPHQPQPLHVQQQQQQQQP